MNETIGEDEITKSDKKAFAIVVHVLYFSILSCGVAAGMSNHNDSLINGALILTIIAGVVACLINGLKQISITLAIALLVSLFFNFVITKEVLQQNKLEKFYSSHLYQNQNYANTENGKIIKKALEAYNEDNYKIAFDVLKKHDQNESKNIEDVMNLVNVTKAITPELIPDLKVAMADDFVSIEEYNILKEKAVKNITSKKLTTEQLVLLGSIK